MIVWKKGFPSDVIVFFSGYVSFSQVQLVVKTGGMHHIDPLIPSISLGFCLLTRLHDALEVVYTNLLHHGGISSLESSTFPHGAQAWTWTRRSIHRANGRIERCSSEL